MALAAIGSILGKYTCYCSKLPANRDKPYCYRYNAVLFALPICRDGACRHRLDFGGKTFPKRTLPKKAKKKFANLKHLVLNLHSNFIVLFCNHRHFKWVILLNNLTGSAFVIEH